MSLMQIEPGARHLEQREVTVPLPRCDCCGALVPIPESPQGTKHTSYTSCMVCGHQNRQSEQ